MIVHRPPRDADGDPLEIPPHELQDSDRNNRDGVGAKGPASECHRDAPDAAGNFKTATAVPVFNKNGRDDDDKDKGKGDDQDKREKK